MSPIAAADNSDEGREDEETAQERPCAGHLTQEQKG
jgi:hypothetical protein